MTIKIIQTILIIIALSFVLLLVMSPIIVVHHLAGVKGVIIYLILCIVISIYSHIKNKGA